MDRYQKLGLEYGKAICYSGYRKDQSPVKEIYPTYEQIKEDLLILNGQWDYLRLYDCSVHAEMVLDIIQGEKLSFKVMLGAFIEAEMNNFGCPWGGIYPEKTLELNRKKNLENIEKLISLSNKYRDIIFATSAGNEATVEWTDHFVPVENVIEYVRSIKDQISQPVTFCENYLPWHDRLGTLAEEVDFISIHTYPVWEHKNIHEAMKVTKQNFTGVASKYPGKPVMITEAGWATNSDGRGINPVNVSEEYQEIYINNLLKWSDEEGIITFIFEAFDEPWKGFSDELEPEKHWGLFYENRKPKKVMKSITRF
jgi:exo-beta-1,3-glucanase (GH17 family)